MRAGQCPHLGCHHSHEVSTAVLSSLLRVSVVISNFLGLEFRIELLRSSVSKEDDMHKDKIKRWRRVHPRKKEKIRHVDTKNTIHFNIDVSTSLWTSLKNRGKLRGILESMKEYQLFNKS